MNSRERTFLALEHKASDRIPIDFWITPAANALLETESGCSYEEFLEYYDVDFRYIEGPTYIGDLRLSRERIFGVSGEALLPLEQYPEWSLTARRWLRP